MLALDPGLRGIAWMTVATLAFAAMTLCARVGASHVPWIEVALARCVFSCALALLVARARGSRILIRGRPMLWIRTGLGTFSLLVTFFLYGQPSLPLGDIAALGALTPVILAVLAPLVLKEHTSRRIWLATPVAFGGVLLLIQPSFEIAGHLAAIALVSATLSAGAMLALRRLSVDEAPESVAAHFAGVAALACLVGAIPTWSWPSGGDAGWLLATGILGGIGQITMTRAYALDSAARVGIISYLGTVVVQLLAVLLLGEKTSPHQVAGSVLVLSSGLFLAHGALQEQARARAAARP